jgi:DNA-binding GntR family transcriptional regulator
MAVLLDNALVVSPTVLSRMGEQAIEAIRATGRDIHQRDLAALWGVPRNTARAVVSRLIHDGVLERGSSVHVRAARRRRS